jgi:predicted nucleotidyltransferase
MAFWFIVRAGFHSNSDIDLLVEVLAAEDVLHALALAEAFISRPLDLKRAEDLGQELCQRLLRTSEAL